MPKKGAMRPPLGDGFCVSAIDELRGEKVRVPQATAIGTAR
jgi:hypothetical protein